MFNPVNAMKAVKDELTKNPELLNEWNRQADTDPEAVRKAIIEMAAGHGIKLSAGQLKLAVKAGKPFLGKLNPAVREQAEQLFAKLF